MFWLRNTKIIFSYALLSGGLTWLILGVPFIVQKTCVNLPLPKRPEIGIQGLKVLQNAPIEHSAILSTFIKLPFVIKIFVLSIYEWLYTGFTV